MQTMLHNNPRTGYMMIKVHHKTLVEIPVRSYPNGMQDSDGQAKLATLDK